MQGLSVDFSKLDKFVSNDELKVMEYKIKNAHRMLNERNGAGRNMLGWLDLPTKRNEEEIEIDQNDKYWRQ